MIKVNLILLVVAFTISSIANAANKSSDFKDENLSNEIKELLKSPSFKIDDELLASVTFTLNNKKEIVVLSVDSGNEMIENYIKSRLNYKKVGAKINSNIKTYTMPVRIVEK